MRLHLAGYLNDYDSLHRADIVIEIPGKQHLRTILSDLGVPAQEVFLVSINGQAVEFEQAWVLPGDAVKVYPPMGGG
jgi:sulfur carrier protein ThiS